MKSVSDKISVNVSYIPKVWRGYVLHKWGSHEMLENQRTFLDPQVSCAKAEYISER